MNVSAKAKWVAVMAILLVNMTLKGQSLSLTSNNEVIPFDSRDFNLSNNTDFGDFDGGLNFSNSVVQEHTYTIENIGSSELVISAISIQNFNSEDFFSLRSTFSGTIQPNQSATFTIGFSRLALGIGIAKVTIGSNDPNRATFMFLVKGDSDLCECPNPRIGNFPDCDECLPGFRGFPDCTTCSDPKHTGTACDSCLPQFTNYPECNQCANSKHTGADCDSCLPQFTNYPECNQCSNP
ncbi:MAG: hypothetical protein AAFQ02_08950, partial [Bacteroidota bacterium]